MRPMLFIRVLVIVWVLLLVSSPFSDSAIPAHASKVFGSEEKRWYLMGRPGGSTENYVTNILVINKANSDYQYAALYDGGMLVSKDGGVTWTNILDRLEPLSLTSYQVQQIVPDVIDPLTVYAVVGYVAVVSHDAGDSWELLRDPAYAVGVGANGQTIYVISETSIDSSLDQGKLWMTFLYSGSPEWIAQIQTDAEDPNIAYVLIDGQLYLTTSGGQEWTNPALLGSTNLVQVFSDYTVPGLAYAVTEEDGLYRTTDGGASWGLAADLSPYNQGFTNTRILGAWDGQIFLKGASTNSYVLYFSSDQGITWERRKDFPELYHGLDTEGSQIDSVVPDEQRQGFYAVAFYRGIGLFTVFHSPNNGITWESIEPVSNPHHISVSADGQTIYAAGSLRNISHSTNGGRTWQNLSAPFDGSDYIEIFGVVQSGTDANTAYLGAGAKWASSTIFKTTDGGGTWQPLPFPDWIQPSEINEIELNPENADLIYLGDPNVFSTDGGTTWQSWPQLEDREIYDIDVSGPNQLYLGLVGYESGGLYWTADGGSTVQVRGLGPDFNVYDIAHDPNNPNTLFVLAEANDEAGVYRSNDGGVAWQPLSTLDDMGYGIYPGSYGHDFLGELLVDPRDPNTLYLARGEMFRSTDGGITWEPFMAGMSPNDNISDITMSTDPLILYAAGHSGVWRINLDDSLPASIPPGPEPASSEVDTQPSATEIQAMTAANAHLVTDFRTLQAPGGVAAFSLDGTKALSVYQPVTIWELESNRDVVVLGEVEFRVSGAAWSPDGTKLAAVGRDGSIVIWDAVTGQALQQIDRRGDLFTMAWTPDSAKVIVGGFIAPTVEVWDVASGTQIRTFESVGGTTFGLALSPDGTILAAGNESSRLYLWNFETGAEIANLEVEWGGINSLAFSPDGTLLAMGQEESISVFDVATLSLVSKMDAPGMSLLFSPNGSVLASTANDWIVLWDPLTGSQLAALSHDSIIDPVSSLWFAPDSSVLISGDTRGKIMMWGIPPGVN